MSYIGHGLSHAVFGGAVVAYVLSLNFYVGAGLWGFAAALIINAVARQRRIGADAAIGIVTTASFAVGVALVSKTRSFTQNFEAALFGNILGVTRHRPARHRRRDARGRRLHRRSSTSACCSSRSTPRSRRSSACRREWSTRLFALALAATIVASINVVGVTLIAATLIIPATTARMLTDSFARMLLLSAAFGAAAGAVGMYASYWLDISSGATIVLLAAALFAVVLAATSLSRRSSSADAPIPVMATERPSEDLG